MKVKAAQQFQAGDKTELCKHIDNATQILLKFRQDRRGCQKSGHERRKSRQGD